MDLDEIDKIMDKFEKLDICEFELEKNNFRLYLNKDKKKKAKIKVEKTKETDNNTVTNRLKEIKVTSPIVGIIYLQSKPGEKPYVKVGDRIKKGEVIAMIEAMKMMTEIESTATGIVTAINVKNEELVECGQSLITIREEK
ncbi:acetyl-CoA carboxylase biotin carboxyl carrier protein [Lactobacillus hominis]|uniref:acetyl-CoA carboxylase biotin carboxyl carrier protein n=1 Tax=Lactobacillus hominis TaxID=1203033 RepID=UPI0026EFD2E4|nr:biotin/lipoyl-containing protein [Lactobacillus hominis]